MQTIIGIAKTPSKLPKNKIPHTLSDSIPNFQFTVLSTHIVLANLQDFGVKQKYAVMKVNLLVLVVATVKERKCAAPTSSVNLTTATETNLDGMLSRHPSTVPRTGNDVSI